MTALLLAVIAPLLIRGAAQVTVEHADTIAAFEQHREAMFRDRGWEPDSPMAQIYERRLRQPQPTGWFFTTNIYASIMLAAAVILAGLTVAVIRARLSSGWIGICGALALLCAGMVWLSGSRGAIVALLVGLIVCLIPLANAATRKLAAALGPGALLAVVALALLGVVVRGVALPEDFLSEKSLLFRWHYLLGAAEMFARHWLIGIGPDGFQAAYMQVRPPRGPEEVISAHSIFTDWLATLGVAALAWIAMTINMLWRAGTSAIDAAEQPTPSPASFAIALRITAIVAAIAFTVGLAAEMHTLDALMLSLRVLGVVGYIAVAIALVYLLPRIDLTLLNWSIASAAAALLVHSQIEMTFFANGSVVWAMGLLGLAAAGGRPTEGARSMWPGFLAAGVIAIAAALIVFGFAIPAQKQQRIVQQAAESLHPPADSPAGQIARRSAAAGELVRAHAQFPSNLKPLHAAVRQFEIAASLTADPHRRISLFGQALQIADQLVAIRPDHEALATRGALYAHLASINPEQGPWHWAIDDAAAVTRLDPHSNMSWLTLGDYLWAADRKAEATDAYRRALLNDANLELDPLKQLPEHRRTTIRRRIAAVEARQP